MSQKQQSFTSYPSARGALLKSARTSAPYGVVPSAPGRSRRSSNEDANALAAAQTKMDPPPEDPRLASTGAQRLRNGASLRPSEETDESVRFLRETSADLPCARPLSPTNSAPCGVELPPKLHPQPLQTVGEVPHLRGEERREWYRWPIAHRETPEVPRRSPQCVIDPGRGFLPDLDPSRTQPSKLLLPLRDTRELLQTPMHSPVSPTHLPTHNLHGDG